MGRWHSRTDSDELPRKTASYPQEDLAETEADGGATLITICLAAMSGSLVSFLVGGDFLVVAIMLGEAALFSYFGWWLRSQWH